MLLGGHLLGEDGRVLEQDFLRAPLAGDVAPGDTVEVKATVVAPAATGGYRVQLDMVDEGIAWFAGRGGAALEIALTVA